MGSMDWGSSMRPARIDARWYAAEGRIAALPEQKGVFVGKELLALLSGCSHEPVPGIIIHPQQNRTPLVVARASLAANFASCHEATRGSLNPVTSITAG